MVKRKKINNKGFMLAETLVVSIFVMTIFSLIYANVLPLIAEYDKAKNYNNVDDTYRAHWARKLVLDGLDFSFFSQTWDKGYMDVTDCSLYTRNEMENWCNNYKSANDVDMIYLTTYPLIGLKSSVKSSNDYSRDFKEYIKYLPNYDRNGTKITRNYFHVIIRHKKKDGNSYAIMEVHR